MISAMMIPTSEPHPYLIRDAFQRFYPSYLSQHPDLPTEKRKAAECIMKCKTGELGYNIAVCKECGYTLIHTVSCNNRSCPCCQAPLAKKWEMARNSELIEGIAYYHVVFTLPHKLNRLILANLSVLLALLFHCVQETLLVLCADPRFMGAKPGIFSVLHTWGQELTFHPHIHACVSGGGITPCGKFVETRHKGFFIPEAAIAKMFRGKFLCSLKKLYADGKLSLSLTPELQAPSAWQSFVDDLFATRWLPFVKETFNGKGNAVRYLARYSYRTAIANSRIVSVDDKTVTFRYLDYADNRKEKLRTVAGETFIGLFLLHILPAGFHRVRFAGYLTNSQKSKCLKLIHRLRNSVYPGNPCYGLCTSQLMKLFYGRDICICPVCAGQLQYLPRGQPLSTVSFAATHLTTN